MAYVDGSLRARTYFDRLVTNLEGLVYELSLSSQAPFLDPTRQLLERLGALGLFTSPRRPDDPSPSFWTAFVPPALQHLHPHSASGLQPYSPTFFPTLLLPLTVSVFQKAVTSLIDHLANHLIDAEPLDLRRADERIKRAAEVFERFVGSAQPGADAMEAVMQDVTHPTVGGMDDRSHARTRLLVLWVASGAQEGEISYHKQSELTVKREQLSLKRFCLSGQTPNTSSTLRTLPNSVRALSEAVPAHSCSTKSRSPTSPQPVPALQLLPHFSVSQAISHLRLPIISGPPRSQGPPTRDARR